MNPLPELAPLGLLLVRPGFLVTAAPVFGMAFAPAPVKASLIGLLAIVLLPLVTLPPAVAPGTYVLLVGREAVIGLALATAVRLVVSGAELAGHLIGFQIGFAYASLIDPQSGVRNNLLSALYGSLVVLVFFAANAHHDLLRALVESYTALPIGTGGLDTSLVDVVTRMLGLVFVLGLQLAAPLLIVLLIVEVALGLLARVAPSLNLMALGFSVRVLVGLVALAAVIRLVPPVVARFITPALGLAADGARVFR